MQRTVREAVHTEGVGLHSGKAVRMSLLPSPVDTGIRFVRTDLSKARELPASVDWVVPSSLATVLGDPERPENRVGTIEHLMSALRGLGVDNLVVQLNGPEVPIMDGSAASFVYLLQMAGLEEQEKARKVMVIQRPCEVRSGDAWAMVRPAPACRFTYRMVYDHPYLSRFQTPVSVDITDQNYELDVSRARTFGLAAELDAMRERNLALGANTSNAIAVSDYRVLNESGLRYPDEFQRHKLLDAHGDLALLGHPIQGHFRGHKSGHSLNAKLARAILTRRGVFKLVDPELAPDAAPVTA